MYLRVGQSCPCYLLVPTYAILKQESQRARQHCRSFSHVMSWIWMVTDVIACLLAVLSSSRQRQSGCQQTFIWTQFWCNNSNPTQSGTLIRFRCPSSDTTRPLGCVRPRSIPVHLNANSVAIPSEPLWVPRHKAVYVC